MIEAEITCECAAIRLPDLGLSLTKGVVVYIEADKARKSIDLQRAWKALGVSVKYVQRYRERRSEPQAPPVPSPSPPPQIQPLSLTQGVVPPGTSLDVDALAERVIELLIPRLQQMLESVVAGISVTQVIGASSAAPAFVEGRMQVTDDVPVFIPSKIGRDDMRSTVDVSATKGADDGGVTDAVAALKAARKEKS